MDANQKTENRSWQSRVREKARDWMMELVLTMSITATLAGYGIGKMEASHKAREEVKLAASVLEKKYGAKIDGTEEVAKLQAALEKSERLLTECKLERLE